MQFPAETNSGNKNFLKLKNGETVTGIFRGQPYDFRIHWKEGRSMPCASFCELCKKGDKPSFRFRINFIINENNVYTAKLFEQGKKVYEMMKNLNQDYDLEKTIVKISRTGEKTSTVYSILPIPNGTISPQMEQTISQVKLLDVMFPVKEEFQASDAAEFSHSDGVPF